jgi:exopolyphosphatase/guanosine-5'-triphosphate,3'-diphosphate pyrophosphatase
MTRFAAIDCGTNTLRLLIAEVDPAGRVADVERRLEFVRLGEGVDSTGVISDAALGRALAATADYAARCERAGVRRVRFVATSAARDAGNAAEFLAGVGRVLGVEPEVISGAEEAALSFAGAVRDLTEPAPYLVVDIGGGSTELVLGDRQVEAARSVDVGSVRLTERHLGTDPPTPGQIGRAEADIRAGLDVVARTVPIARARTLVGVAGTVTTLTAHALRLAQYRPGALHHRRLAVGSALAACDDLLRMPREARLGLPYLPPGRVDVIGAGALIWRAVVRRVASAAGLESVLTSEHDLLDGIVAGLARG